MTGADFLMMMAVEAAESDLPYAGRFKDHELTPVSIIFTACQAAAKRGDKESQAEVLTVGLSLLAKWPEYLAMGRLAGRLALSRSAVSPRNNSTVSWKVRTLL